MKTKKLSYIIDARKLDISTEEKFNDVLAIIYEQFDGKMPAVDFLVTGRQKRVVAREYTGNGIRWVDLKGKWKDGYIPENAIEVYDSAVCSSKILTKGEF